MKQFPVDWRQGVLSSVPVEIAVFHFYVDGLFDASPEPAGLTVKNLDIIKCHLMFLSVGVASHGGGLSMMLTDSRPYYLLFVNIF